MVEEDKKPAENGRGAKGQDEQVEVVKNREDPDTEPRAEGQDDGKGAGAEVEVPSATRQEILGDGEEVRHCWQATRAPPQRYTNSTFWVKHVFLSE